MITCGLGVYLDGNLFWACVISLRARRLRLPARLGRPRRHHAAVGRRVHLQLAHHPPDRSASPQSFGNAMIWIFWIYVLAPLDRRPGLDHHSFSYLGWTGADARLGRRAAPWGMFVVATIAQHPRLHDRGLRRQDLRHASRRSIMFFGLGGMHRHRPRPHVLVQSANFVANWDAAAAAVRLARSTTSSSPRSRRSRVRPCRRTSSWNGDAGRAWWPCRWLLRLRLLHRRSSAAR